MPSQNAGEMHVDTTVTASSVSGTSTNTLTLTFGATPRLGSLIIVGAAGNGGTNAWTGPSGYTLLTGSPVRFSSSARSIWTWAKISDGTETQAVVTGTATTTGIAVGVLCYQNFMQAASGVGATINYSVGSNSVSAVASMDQVDGSGYSNGVGDAPAVHISVAASTAVISGGWGLIGGAGGVYNDQSVLGYQTSTGLSSNGTICLLMGHNVRNLVDSPTTLGSINWTSGAGRTMACQSLVIRPANSRGTTMGVGT